MFIVAYDIYISGLCMNLYTYIQVLLLYIPVVSLGVYEIILSCCSMDHSYLNKYIYTNVYIYNTFYMYV